VNMFQIEDKVLYFLHAATLPEPLHSIKNSSLTLSCATYITAYPKR